jgi:hypothetical protein
MGEAALGLMGTLPTTEGTHVVEVVVEGDAEVALVLGAVLRSIKRSVASRKEPSKGRPKADLVRVPDERRLPRVLELVPRDGDEVGGVRDVELTVVVLSSTSFSVINGPACLASLSMGLTVLARVEVVLKRAVVDDDVGGVLDGDEVGRGKRLAKGQPSNNNVLGVLDPEALMAAIARGGVGSQQVVLTRRR